MAADLKRVDVPLVAFAALVAAIHVGLYVATTGSPLDQAPRAWHGWWDQGQYLRSAAAFAAARLDAAEHWYALGYPLLGAPFVALLPNDPFFLVNTASVVVFALAFLSYFRPVIGALPAMASFLVAQLLPARLEMPHPVEHLVWLQYVIPWNTIPVAALLMVLLVEVAALRREASVGRDVRLGGLAAAIVAIRPGDVLPVLVAAAFYVWHRIIGQRAFANAATAAGAAGLVLGVYGVLSWCIYGGLATPYHTEVGVVGASASDFHERAFAILVDAGATHDEPGAALAALQPWLVLALPLALAWAVFDPTRGRLAVTAAAASLVTYISYNDFWPFALVRLSLIHYIAWTLPLLTAAGIAGARIVVRDRRWGALGVALVASLALATLRPIAQPVTIVRAVAHALPNGATRYEMVVAGPTEIDAIDFPGARTSDPRAVTLKAFDVTADGRPLPLFAGYRPIQLRDALRLGVNRHLEAAVVTVVLDNTVVHHPPAADVRLLAFRLRVTWPSFWRTDDPGEGTSARRGLVQ